MAVDIVRATPVEQPITEIVAQASPYVGVKVRVLSDHVEIRPWDTTIGKDGGVPISKVGIVKTADLADLGAALITIAKQLQGGK